ncbi:hypothetical protein [Mycetocola spongiae]|uniref:hypothetical protein n=1 Tax=Mycetocola spongiae TaxID=2859226 RepID=UPI001CF3319F|nr:hypothetical protein [Mycetocola spongiae]UCR89124.1 hypothetical protein KXZ72_14520 [Mycetocola spongiae]
MSTEREDDALSWAGGEDDPTLVDTPGALADAPAEEPEVPAAGTEVAPGWRVVGGTAAASPARESSADEAEAETPDPNARPAQMSSPVLLLHGVLGGIYLLYVIGWLASVGHFSTAGTDPLQTAMTVLGQVFAVIAPALWFGAVLWVTRRAESVRWRLIWLLIGALVLAPVPFILGVR